jgi:hypothetical protein
MCNRFCPSKPKEITRDELEEIIDALAVQIAGREYQMRIYAKDFQLHASDSVKQKAAATLFKAHKQTRDRYVETHTKLSIISVQISNAADAHDIVMAMGNAKDTLEGLLQKVNVADVDSIMDQLSDYKVETEEIMGALGRTDTVVDEEDDAELMMEFLPEPPLDGFSVPLVRREAADGGTVPINTKQPVLV